MARMASDDFARLLRMIRDEDHAEIVINGLSCHLDHADFKRVSQYSWWLHRRPATSYAVTKVNGQVISMHRFIMLADGADLVDHIDGNGLNNQRHNLRICTHAENMRNRHSTSGASRFKGVHLDKGVWRAQIQIGGKRIQLGSYTTETKAAAAYDRAARKHHGEFACTNRDLGLFREQTP